MLGFAGWYDTQPYRDFLFYMPFQHIFFIGPVLFFYTQSLLNPSFRFGKKEFLHLIPGILYVFYIASIWVYDKLILHEYYFYKNGMDKDFDYWYQKTGLLSMLFYFIITIRYYNRYRKFIFEVTSNAESVLFNWIKTYLYAFLLMLLLPFVFDIITYFFPKMASYTGSWWFFLFFSIIMYYIAITGYSNAVNTKVAFQMSVFNSSPILLLNESQSNLEEPIVIDIDYETFEVTTDPEIELWKTKINLLIETEKLYQNPELTLAEVSRKLQTNAAIISRAINQGFQMNFNDFINNYRIEAVKTKFELGEHKKSTLLGLAFDSGFNSKATFNRAFKKNTGFSPKEFIEKL
jgi:AraC-like DNA-binding protein